VKQPWAELIASGRKTIEVRSWQRSHRGPLLIVASASPNRAALERFDMRSPACGVAVCIVDVVGVEMMTRQLERIRARIDAAAQCSPAQGDYLWFLENPRRVEPFAVKGVMFLYDVADALIKLAPGAAATG
jgi:hypothetical protein